jgi:hypothetical protein
MHRQTTDTIRKRPPMFIRIWDVVSSHIAQRSPTSWIFGTRFIWGCLIGVLAHYWMPIIFYWGAGLGLLFFVAMALISNNVRGGLK